MSNNLIKIEDDFQEENEINIYDIINIFIKNIRLFIIVSIIAVSYTHLIGRRSNLILIFFKVRFQEKFSQLIFSKISFVYFS